MPNTPDAAESLRAGDVATALKALTEAVKTKPADAKLRIFLFQLLAVLGRWERALTQLKVASELDPSALAMAHMYRDAIHAEALRAKVFTGEKVPMVFGQPEEWLALLIESLVLAGRGQANESAALRAKAFDQASAASGTIDDKPFEWIADADSRLGPVLEAVINGKYYWVPFARLTRIAIEAPTDLRDVVWTPVHLEFENGGESVALIPTRYPGSEAAADGAIALARKTVWEEIAPDTFRGLGQRVLATDAGEFALMDVREIRFGVAEAG